MILGIDEVGRGAWAGPLVVGAAVLHEHIDGLTDSKLLTKSKREALYDVIDTAATVKLGWVTSEEIDAIGLSEALRLATVRAVEQIDVPYHDIIIDGTQNFLMHTTKGQYVTTLKKADLLIPTVSAAAITAKVARDRYMVSQSSLYPQYGFDQHVGYGTKMHQDALALYGATPLHRMSFAPLKAHNQSVDVTKKAAGIGMLAEREAALYLHAQGHTIIERNWKTKVCEVDIVSEKNNIWYFTEVKYRRQPRQGGGLAAITSKKQQQMRFAADVFCHYRKDDSHDRRLMAIAMSGEIPVVDLVVEV
ncbi:MAG: putative Ribonuclease [Candidatus Saccharibacteria bacterium]|nr:putative Ribonuclease [Candidatus Saccharibacteria bacterium]